MNLLAAVGLERTLVILSGLNDDELQVAVDEKESEFLSRTLKPAGIDLGLGAETYGRILRACPKDRFSDLLWSGRVRLDLRDTALWAYLFRHEGFRDQGLCEQLLTAASQAQQIRRQAEVFAGDVLHAHLNKTDGVSAEALVWLVKIVNRYGLHAYDPEWPRVSAAKSPPSSRPTLVALAGIVDGLSEEELSRFARSMVGCEAGCEALAIYRLSSRLRASVCGAWRRAWNFEMVVGLRMQAGAQEGVHVQRSVCGLNMSGCRPAADDRCRPGPFGRSN